MYVIFYQNVCKIEIVALSRYETTDLKFGTDFSNILFKILCGYTILRYPVHLVSISECLDHIN